MLLEVLLPLTERADGLLLSPPAPETGYSPVGNVYEPELDCPLVPNRCSSLRDELLLLPKEIPSALDSPMISEGINVEIDSEPQETEDVIVSGASESEGSERLAWLCRVGVLWLLVLLVDDNEVVVVVVVVVVEFALLSNILVWRVLINSL